MPGQRDRAGGGLRCGCGAGHRFPVPPPAGLRGPSQWGTEGRLAELFAEGSLQRRTQQRTFAFRYRSPAHWLEVFRTWYGPVNRAFAALAPERQDGLASDLVALIERHNVARDGTMVVPSAYLEAVITRA